MRKTLLNQVECVIFGYSAEYLLNLKGYEGNPLKGGEIVNNYG